MKIMFENVLKEDETKAAAEAEAKAKAAAEAKAKAAKAAKAPKAKKLPPPAKRANTQGREDSSGDRRQANIPGSRGCGATGS